MKIEKLMLHLEKRLLLEVDDVIKGLMAYFAYHYAANYEYSPHERRFVSFWKSSSKISNCQLLCCKGACDVFAECLKTSE